MEKLKSAISEIPFAWTIFTSISLATYNEIMQAVSITLGIIFLVYNQWKKTKRKGKENAKN